MPTLTIQTSSPVKTETSDTYVVVPLHGKIDEDNLHRFKEVIEPLLESKHNYLVFDLDELELINSHVVGYLNATHQKLREREKQMAFVKANREILNLLELVGLIQIVPNFDSEEDLINAIRDGDI